MRHKKIPYTILPKQIATLEEPAKEASFFAKQFKRAKSKKAKSRVIYGLMANARKWDVITRTFPYYITFEKEVGKSFPEFWNRDTGGAFIEHMNLTLFKTQGR